MSKKTKFDQVDLAQLAKKHDERGTQAQEFDMRIDAMGQWFHQGDQIKRPALVKLFASVLTRLDDGQYWLITPAERGVIAVEDVPFYAVKMDVEGAEYLIIKELAESNVLCDYISMGNKVVMIVEMHVNSITSREERQRLHHNFRPAKEKLEGCGVQFGKLNAFWA